MTELDRALGQLRERRLPDGGLAGQPGGAFRPDATAWAVLAWSLAGQEAEAVTAARERLRASQLPDGRIPSDPHYTDAYWPTADSLLAWHGAADGAPARDRALDFLLKNKGRTYKAKKGNAPGHDVSIPGWSWVDNTHPWVEPTAMSLLALELAGRADDPRAVDGRRLLADRQLGKGGWNYGNTKTYGVETHPSMESTGLALQALAGHADAADVQRSLDYLREGVPGIRGPLWLGWAILGLSAWGQRPAAARDWIGESLARQADYGSYDTAWIGVLIVAAHCERGLLHALKEKA